MSDIIKFYKGEETGIIKENYSIRNASIFAEQYTMALEAIRSYLTASKGDDKSIVYDRSNIFAFIGDRGTGKTSCMQSVAGMLEPYYKEDSNEDLKSLILPIIDPTIFDEKSNILNVVIGTLFQEFKEAVSRNKRYDSEENEKDFDDKKQNLLGAFQKVRDCIKIISDQHSLKCESDDISQLADMASVSILHKRMGNLVEKYLMFFGKKVLILQIDDIDLQTQYAYRMIEEIRKYFVLPNVVILMSFKLEQLTKVIELANANNFKELKNYGLIDSVNIEEIAARYILKLIPVNHRIYMPTFEVYADSLIEYLPNHEQGQKSLIGDGSPISVKYAITTLIFEKCRFLFYHSRGVVSPIVPRNLRELRFLLAMMVDMKDYYYNGKNSNAGVQKNNKGQFLNYFNNTWVGNNISANNLSIVNAIRDTRDASLINKIVLTELQKKYNDILNSEFKEILNVKNSSYNVSIADVFVVLDYIKQRISSSDDKMLIFFIETYYSFKLYEYYDELTEKTSKGESVEEKNERLINNSIRKKAVVDGFSNYAILVGGRFINPEYNNLLPLEQETKIPRDYRPILFQLLKQYAQEVIDAKEMTDDLIQKMHIVEFFALCISRVLQAGDNTTNANYRVLNELSYNFVASNQNKTVQFDLGAFFFNIANIRSAYDRVHIQLYDKAVKDKTSLYSLLLRVSKDFREEYSEEHALLSCACIRNYEILSDFIYKIQFSKLQRSPSKSNIENLRDFFHKVASYKILNYDRHNDKKGRKIPNAIYFGYASVIEFFLSKIDANGRDIFESIYNPKEIEEDKMNKSIKKGITLDTFDVDLLMKLLPDKDEFSLHTLRRRVRDCCDPIFRGNRALTHKWLYHDIYRNGITGKKISREKALETLTRFKEENNL